MTQLRPLGEPQAVDVEFQYTVSGEWIEQNIREQGIRMPRNWKVKFSLPEVPAQLRIRLYRAHAQYKKMPGYPTFRAPTEDPEEFLVAIEDWIESAAADQTSDDSFDGMRTSWIGAHGSDRLRIAQERGYKVNRLYAVERAAHEFPQFWIDTSNESVVRERTDPSMKALEIEDMVRKWIVDHELDERLDPKIVWLVEPPNELQERLEESGDYFEQQEAILISSYLGRYSVVMPIAAELRNTEQVDQ